MRRTWREPRLKTGALLLTHNQLAFLQGLLDRPRGAARSRHDLVRAALPYVKRFRRLPSYWSLYHASLNLPVAWVARRREGNRIEFTLRPRGRAIIEGRAGAIRLRGIGPWGPRSRPADII